MDVLSLALTFSVTVTLVGLLLGCVNCRKKPALTEEEIQRKHFEKFRKRHMRPTERRLGVDVIRHAAHDAEVKQADLQKNTTTTTTNNNNNTATPTTRTVSVISSVADHTYEDLPSIQQLRGTGEGREHSFFDESFDTVVEVSSSSGGSRSSQSSAQGGQAPPMQQLGIPSNMASYLSLRPDSSTSCLFSASSHQLAGVASGQGEINSAFSTTSLPTTDTPSSNDTYIVPNSVQVPAIKIIKPSFRRPDILSGLHDNIADPEVKITPKRPTAPKRPPNTFYFGDSHYVTMNDLGSPKVQNTELQFKCVQRELLEGPSSHMLEGPGSNTDTHTDSHTEVRRLSLDGSQTLYEKLKESRIDNNAYKSLTSLVLPSRRSYVPRNAKESTQSNHTYDSISVELSCEMLRADTNELDETDHIFQVHRSSPGHGKHFTTPNKDSRRNSLARNELNDLNKSPNNTFDDSADHTYESLRDRFSQGCAEDGTRDLSVVIIGKRGNGLYDSIRSSQGQERMLLRKAQDSAGRNQEFKKPWSESSDRYSPFPSAKKLAFKSSFRPQPSPRTLNNDTGRSKPFHESLLSSGRCKPFHDGLTGSVRCKPFHEGDAFMDRLTPYRIPEGIGNIGSCRRLSVESRDLKTPEIFVDDTPTVFFSPKKQYFRPSKLALPDTMGQNLGISPLCTYNTLKACANMKVRDLGSRKGDKRNSLPSVSDQIEAEIRSHCDLNEFQSSTPSAFS